MTLPSRDVRAAMSGEIRLRPVAGTDRPFLFELYAGTRIEELADVPWSDAEKAAFLQMQFDAQDAWYRHAYPDAAFSVVVSGGTPIGRVIVRRTDDEITLVDIALIAAHRGRGIGTRLLGDLVADADAARVPVMLHVDPGSPARRLYVRHGFESSGSDGQYEAMVRPPIVS